MRPFALLLALALALLSGCATTRIEVTRPDGLRVRASFPKNMDATNISLRVGDNELFASRLRTDASSVVAAQGDIAGEVVKAAALLAP